MDIQIPVTPHNNGKTKTQITWKTNVRHIETNAEIKPLFNAVKNDEIKIFKQNIYTVFFVPISFLNIFQLFLVGCK